jgi:hypothetical protein
MADHVADGDTDRPEALPGHIHGAIDLCRVSHISRYRLNATWRDRLNSFGSLVKK